MIRWLDPGCELLELLDRKALKQGQPQVGIAVVAGMLSELGYAVGKLLVGVASKAEVKMTVVLMVDVVHHPVAENLSLVEGVSGRMVVLLAEMEGAVDGAVVMESGIAGDLDLED